MRQKFGFGHTMAACSLGYVTQAVIVNLAPLLFVIFQDSFGVSIQKITWLITLNFLIQLTVDFSSAKIVDKIGYRPCVVAAHLFAAAGLAGLAVFPRVFSDSYTGLLAAVVLYAIGGGLIEVLISPIVEACPATNKAARMSLLHSFYCWGTVVVILLSTVFFVGFGKESWPVLACLWAVVPLLNAVFFLCVPINRLTEKGQGMRFRTLFSRKIFWAFLLLMVTAGAAEQAMSQWASVFAEMGLGVSKTMGDLIGPCLLAALMGGVRVAYAKFGHKFNLSSVIVGSGLLCILAYLLTAFSPWPLLSLIGCALCGLSLSVLWPGVFSLASAKFPQGGTALFALLALAGDAGCAGGPTLVGLVSGLFGGNLRAGLAAAVVFPVVLVMGTLVYKRYAEPRGLGIHK